VTAALALDQEDRPADTMVFAEALRTGAHGIETPGIAPAAAMGTRATRVLSGSDAPTAATRAATRRVRAADPITQAPLARRLEPRPYATAGYARPAPQYAPEQRRSSQAGRRLAIGLTLLLVFVAAVVIAVVISTNTSKTIVQLRTTVAHDAQSAIHQVQNLISQYTK
jgi:hypothetical protein